MKIKKNCPANIKLFLKKLNYLGKNILQNFHSCPRIKRKISPAALESKRVNASLIFIAPPDATSRPNHRQSKPLGHLEKYKSVCGGPICTQCVNARKPAFTLQNSSTLRFIIITAGPGGLLQVLTRV